MPDPAYYLTEDDRDFLVWLKTRFEKERRTEIRPETKNPRARSPYQPPLEATHPGPKVYVALAPETGIPALSPGGLTGTGSGDFEDDVPGEAECKVFRIDETPGTTGNARMTRIPGLDKLVYNVGPAAVPGLGWVKINKTEGGAWVCDTPAAGSDGGDPGTGAGEVTDPETAFGHVLGASINATLVSGSYVAEDTDTLTIADAGWYMVVLNVDMTPASLQFSYVLEINEKTYGGGPAADSATFYGAGADNLNAFGGASSSNHKAVWRLVVPGSNAERFSATFSTFVETTQPGVRFGIRVVGGGAFTLHTQGLATAQNFTTSLSAVRLHWHDGAP